MDFRCYGIGTLSARPWHQEAAGSPRHAGHTVGLDDWGTQGTDSGVRLVPAILNSL